MNKIEVTLKPDEDGTLHLPLPEELRDGMVRVTALVEPVTVEAEEATARRKRELLEITARLREANPFKSIEDPVAWQRKLREDRVLTEE